MWYPSESVITIVNPSWRFWSRVSFPIQSDIAISLVLRSLKGTYYEIFSKKSDNKFFGPLKLLSLLQHLIHFRRLDWL